MEDPRLSSVIFLILRSPRLGEYCEEETDGVECICPPSDISIDPVLRGVLDASINTDVAEFVAWAVMTLSGCVRSMGDGEHEARTRDSGE